MPRQSLFKRFIEGRKELTRENFWEPFFRELDRELDGFFNLSQGLDGVFSTSSALAVSRIDDYMTPRIALVDADLDRILALIERGFMAANSATEHTLAVDQALSWTIGDVLERSLFTPGPHVTLTRHGSADDYAMLQTVSYDAETGVYEGKVLAIAGNAGPHSDWHLTTTNAALPLVLAALASVQMVLADANIAKTEIETLEGAIADHATSVGEDRAAIALLKTDSETAAGTATDKAAAAAASAGQAAAAAPRSHHTVTADPAPASVGGIYVCDTSAGGFPFTLPGDAATGALIDVIRLGEGETSIQGSHPIADNPSVEITVDGARVSFLFWVDHWKIIDYAGVH